MNPKKKTNAIFFFIKFLDLPIIMDVVDSHMHLWDINTVHSGDVLGGPAELHPVYDTKV
jgi:hypothetical protein